LQKQLVKFGPFEADFSAGELRKNGKRLRLQGQPFQVLAALLENPGRVVSREELRDRLWSADTFVDFDKGLNTAVNKIREVLGDSAEKPRFIETIPRRGYRLIESATGVMPDTTPSVAVLSFLNLSPDPENEFLADGMSEQVINSLMQIKKLRVAARTSSFSFKGKHVDLRVIGEQLNVRAILEGSVQRAGNRLRVTAQLVDVYDGYDLWSEKYDRELEDIFEVQDEIARAIAQRLEVTLDGDQPSFTRAGTQNVEACKAYLQGRAWYIQRGPRLPQSLGPYKNAVRLDPSYGLAWSALADTYNMLGFYGFLKPEACLLQAKDAATRAITLNPSLGEAHTSMAVSRLLCDWDRRASEREFLLAQELSPRYAPARYWYAVFLLHFASGRFKEGLSQAIQVVESDPLSGWARGMLACLHIMTGQLEEAVRMAEANLRSEPDSFLSHWVLITALNAQERYKEAAAFGESVLAISGRHPWLLSALAMSYFQLGKTADSDAIYEELRWRAKREYVSPAVLAWAASANNKKDQAILHAQQAHAIGDPVLLAGKYWPSFARMQKDPRFEKILMERGFT
jgi:TolB-like protein